jgi:hypothetical protein
MVWHAKKHFFIERIAKTGFMVSGISSLTFWGADLIQTAIAGAFGLLLAVLTWHASEDLGSYRVLIALIGLCTPVLVFRLLKH